MSAGKIPAADTGATPAHPSGLAPAPMTLAEAAGGANAAPAEPPKALSEPKSPLAEMRAMIAKGAYDRAVVALNAFVEAHPDDPDVAEAVLLTGDAHFRQKHFQDAAQDYLKLAKTYPSSPQAPVAFVKLGDSLVGMGQKDQACQTYGEFLKRFTDVDAALRARAERSRKGAGC
jgi:tol-pal system protein YbgF